MPEANWAGLHNFLPPFLPPMTFHSLTVPTQYIHTKGKGQGHLAPGPKMVGEQPSAGPQPNFLKEPQNTEVLKGLARKHLLGLEWRHSLSLQHNTRFDKSFPPTWSCLGSWHLHGSWETPGFHLNLPPLMDCGLSPPDTIFLFKGKFWLDFFRERLLLPAVGRRPSSRSRWGQCPDVQFTGNL